MILKEITAAYLKDNGYDGLFHADTCCGCALDDFMPCGEPSPDCEPGYTGEGCSCGGDCVAGIWRDKPISLSSSASSLASGKPTLRGL